MNKQEGSGLKRTFYELRQLILRELSTGQQTINALSKNTGINWRTSKEHLEFLERNGDVTEVVSSEYVRIFRLTAQGEKNAKLASKAKKSSRAGVEVKINGKSEHVERVEIK